MVRFVIIGIVIAVAFTLYALVDAAMTDGSRARGVTKPVWVVLIVVLPVIGGVLWFMIGKGSADEAKRVAPDDDPRFTGTRISGEDLDARMRDLEEQLRALDDEVYPGEGQQSPGSESLPGQQTGSEPAAPGSKLPGPTRSDPMSPDPKSPDSTRPEPARPDSREEKSGDDPGAEGSGVSGEERQAGSDDPESPKR